ncbi:AB-hydrolase YheT [Russula earlei]|uniref:AB-hydrolase YheT n=1 Tax=Russula earlei TaxID=71964 RepID=A0ACC0U294_9AGAM|nr:AB-hydrolase YheT [Russula earlei]
MGLFPFGTSSRSKVAWPQNPAQLVTQTRDSPAQSEKISLRELIENRCPSVLKPFKPAWGLFNGHLQTGYAVVGDFTSRKLLKLKDGGTLGVDFTPPADSGREFQDTTPVVVALHGSHRRCADSSYEAYVRNIIAPAIAPVEEGGLGIPRCCRAGVPLTSPQFYGLSHTDDFRQAIYYIAHMYPHAPLLGIGFSLGANILTRYVAEEGESCRLVSACALACVWATWFSRTAYAKSLGTNLKKVVARHADSIRQFPDSPFAQALPTLLAKPNERLLMRQFDRIVSIQCAGSRPPFPFEDEWEYYKYASSHDKLEAIAWVPLDFDRNQWVTIVVTHGGGHLGWFQSGGSANRWARRPALEWFRATAEGVTFGLRQIPPVKLINGWLGEVGKERLGCKEAGDGGKIQGGPGRKGDVLSGL